MDYHTFPSQHPDNTLLISNARETLSKRFGAEPAPNNMMAINSMTPDDQIIARVLVVPPHYMTNILDLLFCRYVLALILVNGAKDIIKPFKRWACFAQNYLHLANIWNPFQEDITEAPEVGEAWQSLRFDQFIVTEAVVMRHEPVYVSEYRRTRTEDMPNLSQHSIHSLDWSEHERRLARLPHFSGILYGGRIPPIPPSHEKAKCMLAEASDWYDDGNRPMILDTYTDYWDTETVEKVEGEGEGDGEDEGEDKAMNDNEDEDEDEDEEEDQDEDEDEEDDQDEDEDEELGMQVGMGPQASTSTGPASTVQAAATRKCDRSGSNVAAVHSPPRKKPAGAAQGRSSKACRASEYIQEPANTIERGRRKEFWDGQTICRDASKPQYHVENGRVLITGGSSSKDVDHAFGAHIPTWNAGQVNWSLLVTTSTNANVPLPPTPDQNAMDIDDDDVMQGVTVDGTYQHDASRASSSAVSWPSGTSDIVSLYRVSDPTSVSMVPSTIKLLYIPDPSRERTNQRWASTDLRWVRRNLSPEQLTAIAGLKNCTHKVNRPLKADLSVPGTPTDLMEWLWVITCLSECKINGVNAFQVSYMLWDEFKAVMLNPRSSTENKEKWALIRMQDCIISGVDYTINTT
ncbi:hypothetical protein PAXRUDRAFT_17081 [Paxillus rubicundulus Ve08.2h10]|uniref:Uncharacterized protein n=1 Tax=Paxillus rubicundulus Ve08.2h10 TaxID=930991 RepID=A0A0D0DIY6_9AGAM|nr:hypothetical protein PAXRUDRAFT_17081 [Paxillus rubicundulus Ve08.2h10]